jgi:hypothetical protein
MEANLDNLPSHVKAFNSDWQEMGWNPYEQASLNKLCILNAILSSQLKLFNKIYSMLMISAPSQNLSFCKPEWEGVCSHTTNGCFQEMGIHHRQLPEGVSS